MALLGEEEEEEERRRGGEQSSEVIGVFLSAWKANYCGGLRALEKWCRRNT